MDSHKSPATGPFDAAVFIGRFQPPHLGHLDMLRHALQAAPHVVVVIGSAHQARTPKNPFTWQERRDMMAAALPAEDLTRVSFIPMQDFYNEARWVKAVTTDVEAAVRQTQASSATTSLQGPAKIALMAHFKDASSSYLSQFPTWGMLELPRQHDIDATQIRNALFDEAGDNTETLHANLHASTATQLLQWRNSAQYKALQEEWQMLRNYRTSWEQAPYPPVFVTVDALLQCQEHVLLIERGHAPGKGLLALPGGFLEQRDTLWQSCLRELQEETTLTLSDAEWRQAFKQTQVFDHPDRSLRGRTITHVYHFDLGNRALPKVRGSDDAKDALWIPISELASMPERFFDDHFHILESLLLPAMPL